MNSPGFLGLDDPLEKEMATCYSCLGNPMDRGTWQAPRTAVHGSCKRVQHNLVAEQQQQNGPVKIRRKPPACQALSLSQHSYS